MVAVVVAVVAARRRHQLIPVRTRSLPSLQTAVAAVGAEVVIGHLTRSWAYPPCPPPCPKVRPSTPDLQLRSPLALLIGGDPCIIVIVMTVACSCYGGG